MVVLAAGVDQPHVVMRKMSNLVYEAYDEDYGKYTWALNVVGWVPGFGICCIAGWTASMSEHKVPERRTVYLNRKAAMTHLLRVYGCRSLMTLQMLRWPRFWHTTTPRNCVC
jgi:hypothetical protein